MTQMIDHHAQGDSDKETPRAYGQAEAASSPNLWTPIAITGLVTATCTGCAGLLTAAAAVIAALRA
jgi:hypothetical protein